MKTDFTLNAKWNNNVDRYTQFNFKLDVKDVLTKIGCFNIDSTTEYNIKFTDETLTFYVIITKWPNSKVCAILFKEITPNNKRFIKKIINSKWGKENNVSYLTKN